MNEVGFIKVESRRVKYLRDDDIDIWRVISKSGGITIGGVYVVITYHKSSCDLHGYDPNRTNSKPLWTKKNVSEGLWEVSFKKMRRIDAIPKRNRLVEVKPIDNTQSSLDALLELFCYCGGMSFDEATGHAKKFAEQAQNLPISDICSRLLSEMLVKELIDICIEIDDCRDSESVLSVLGVAPDERGPYRRNNGKLLGFVKGLSELVFDCVAV